MKSLFSLLAVAIALSFQSCCCNDEYISYQLTGLETHHLNNEGINFTINANSTPVAAKAYGLQLALTKQESNLGFNAYVECNRDCGSQIVENLENSVDSIRIVTLTDFDSLHPAGTEVTSFFKYSSPNTFRDEELPQLFDLNNTSVTACCMNINLFLYTLPSQTDTFQFEVTATTFQGSFNQTTSPVVLTVN